MVRQKDQFWVHVDEQADGSSKCKYCGFGFSQKTSISRIKSHFSGVAGLGINVCAKVPDNVRDEAYKAAQNPYKRLKTMPSSSNTVSTSSGEQTNEVENGMRDAGMVQTEVWSMKQEVGYGREQINLMERGSKKTDLDLLVQAAQPQHEINTCLTEDHLLHNKGEKIIGEWTQPIEIVIPDAYARKTGGVALTTTELVGQAFEGNKDKIWAWLMKDEVLSIGVYGMGGVGKTTLMTHIHNQLLERPNTFTHIYWVIVSQDFSIYKLQHRIAKAIELDLSKEDDEIIRAKKLCDELIKRKKFVLILDDLWDHFDVEKVGIPIRMNGCKLILTTRSRDICRRMRVCKENIIKVEPLSKEEAWTLFTKELGNYDAKLEPLAHYVAGECAGLPLGLRTMARSMSGVDDVSEWRNTLEELKESEKRQDDMEPEVFRILRYSYNRLNDSTLRDCFLYCALFPEGFTFKKEDLIEYWIVERIIDGKKCRQAEYDKGHAILNKLQNACLLEGCRNDRYLKMHDLIRDMALQKLRQKSSVMVEANAQLKELPDVEKWTEDLVKVSLMQNHIVEIPSSHSSSCLKLSTLLLCNNPINLIADSFFKQLHGLKVLDLSNTDIDKLPDSISELVILNALLLNGCRNLMHRPSLAKLKALKKLDLSFTGLEELPIGIELLSNLRYLNLWGSHVKELPTGLLSNLSHLQVLILMKFYDFEDIQEDKFYDFEGIQEERISLKGKEVACLRKLETLECCFKHLSDFNEYMESWEETLSLCTYSFLIGQLNDLDFCEKYLAYYPFKLSKKILLSECSISRDRHFPVFPEDIQELVIVGCNVPRRLFDDFSLRCSMKLKFVFLYNCKGIRSLLSLSSVSLDIFRSLETLLLYDLKKFRVIINREEAPLPPLPSNGTFSCLKHFEIVFCNRVKRLFHFGLLSNLQNLEIIKVEDCYKMEEILVAKDDNEEDDNDDDEEDDDDNDDEEEKEEENMGETKNSSSHNFSIEFILPKLRVLELRNLPELKSVCSGIMLCDSLQNIVLYRCLKLKRIPLSFPLPSLQNFWAYPKEWWESVEWDQLGNKNLLQPIST